MLFTFVFFKSSLEFPISQSCQCQCQAFSHLFGVPLSCGCDYVPGGINLHPIQPPTLTSWLHLWFGKGNSLFSLTLLVRWWGQWDHDSYPLHCLWAAFPPSLAATVLAGSVTWVENFGLPATNPTVPNQMSWAEVEPTGPDFPQLETWAGLKTWAQPPLLASPPRHKLGLVKGRALWGFQLFTQFLLASTVWAQWHTILSLLICFSISSFNTSGSPGPLFLLAECSKHLYPPLWKRPAFCCKITVLLNCSTS